MNEIECSPGSMIGWRGSRRNRSAMSSPYVSTGPPASHEARREGDTNTEIVSEVERRGARVADEHQLIVPQLESGPLERVCVRYA